MYTSRLEEDEQQDLPDTDYNTMIALEREKKKRAAEEQERLANRTPEEKEADAQAYQRNLVKCPNCLTVLGRRDILGNDVIPTIREHQEFCYQAQEAKKEKDAILKIQRDVLSAILTVCVDTNMYRSAAYYHELEPAPHHMNRPDSEDYKFEKEWREKQLDIQSSNLVFRWKQLRELFDSSDIAKKEFIKTWKQQVSTYIDRNGLKMYRMKSFQIP